MNKIFSKKRIFTISFFSICFLINIVSQETPKIKMVLSFSDVIRLANEQSPQAIRSKHEFRGKYWEYRSYKAQQLPNMTLNTNPFDLNRSITKITQNDGTELFLVQKNLNSTASLSLSQNIIPTGGSIFLNSQIQRLDGLSATNPVSFQSIPISIGIRQPVNGYNSMKWSKKIEPLRFEEAKKMYLYDREAVSLRAVNLFFDLALAQINFEIAKVNFSNADTLYKISKGRYNMGTIAENELLQMELSRMNSATDLNQTSIDLQLKKSQLASFLGYNEKVEIEIKIPQTSPGRKLNLDSVLNIASSNSPNIISFERQLLEADRNVAQTKADKTISANIFAEYGYVQTGQSLNDVYKKLQDHQLLQIGMEIPLIDWGQRKGKYKMAQSYREVVKSSIEQQRTDFEQNVFLKVMQYNLQGDLLYSASKADTIGQMRYAVSKQRFLIGKISITDLNIALNEKDLARRGYVSALRNYWVNYYDIRSITLYNFDENKPLDVDFDEILK
jgi:outer membrane protein TolC